MFIMEKIGTVILAGKNGKKRKITSYKAYYMIERFVHFFSITNKKKWFMASYTRQFWLSMLCFFRSACGSYTMYSSPPQTKKHLL
jgi:hypothetical protein